MLPRLGDLEIPFLAEHKKIEFSKRVRKCSYLIMSSKQRLSPTKLFNTTNLNSNKKDFSNNILENIVHWSQTCHDTILCCSSSSNSSDDSFSKCLILPLKGGSDNGQFVYFGDAILLNNKSNVKIVEGGKINQDEIIIKIDQHKIAGCTLQDVQTLIQTKSTNGQKIILKTCKTGE
ncbi:unnamed protein product [Didymodactylos carnosus]|uniref:PDZ domain-containing protein n=1 Tax=Didymodactylos carnosus TaxID=1234261 RepID=A0A815WVI2_9BILA|nr:unnamed protein product [Didymodactylos carnosus]CAF1550285.1 unnamed protein product [Didymodactylos carnosus]CAF4214619.1 unnamed protein product [Didymodactylos carnosus]CAF4411330.1 unnamed protein product [Didymodactylos carnosus]